MIKKAPDSMIHDPWTMDQPTKKEGPITSRDFESLLFKISAFSHISHVLLSTILIACEKVSASPLASGRAWQVVNWRLFLASKMACVCVAHLQRLSV
jgi:hypothetical protein